MIFMLSLHTPYEVGLFVPLLAYRGIFLFQWLSNMDLGTPLRGVLRERIGYWTTAMDGGSVDYAGAIIDRTIERIHDTMLCMRDPRY